METLETLKAKFEECVQETTFCDLELDKLEAEEDAWEKEYGKYTREQRAYVREKEVPLNQRKAELWEQIETVFKDMIALQPDYILELLQEYHKKQDFDSLDIVIEYMKMWWYPTTPENTIETVIFSQKLILRVATDLLDNQNLTTNRKIMWFVKQVYDIFFHQCGIGGERTELTDLFLQLSLKVLEPKYYALQENELTDYPYDSSIYFISMLVDPYIIDRPKDFFVLWEKMQAYPINFLASHQKAWWTDAYESLTSPTQEL